VSKKQNPVILNEAQHSEESLQKAKYFNFMSSQFPMFLRVLKNAIISLHLRELCDRNIQFPQSFIANEFRQLCFLKNIRIINNLCVSKNCKRCYTKKDLLKISKPFVVKNLCNNYCGKITPSTTCTIPLDAGTVAIIFTVPLIVGLPFTILIVIFLPSTIPND